MPPWYKATEEWLLAKGYGIMTLIALGIVVVTIVLWWNARPGSRDPKPIPFAVWLAYMVLP